VTEPELILKALEIHDAAERARFLERACTDASQRQRVDALLRTGGDLPRHLPEQGASTLDGAGSDGAAMEVEGPRSVALPDSFPGLSSLLRSAPGIGGKEEGIGSRLGEGDAALRDMDECEQLYVELIQRHPGRDDLESLLGDAQAQRGWVLEGIGRRDESARAHALALATHERVSSRHPENLKYVEAVANNRYNLGVAAQSRADPDQAEEHFRRADAAYQRIADARPYEPRHLIDLIGCARCRGQVLFSRGRLPEELEETRRWCRSSRSREVG
jgi:tetratricopeptide (TPR) repeat protein